MDILISALLDRHQDRKQVYSERSTDCKYKINSSYQNINLIIML